MNASDSTPHIYKIVSYEDNRIVVHIFRPDLSYPDVPGKLWIDKHLSFRTIYPDGNVVPVDMKLDIPDVNFCLLDVNGVTMSPIEIFPIRSHYLLVTYANFTDLNDQYTYSEWAMIVDLNGNIYSSILFKSSYINTTNQWLSSRARIFVNFNPFRGFLRLAPITNTTDYIWQQYEVTEKGEILFLAGNRLHFSNFTNLIVTAVPMVDENYLIVYANSTDSETLLQNPFIPRTGIYGIYLDYGIDFVRDPVILHLSSTKGYRITDIDCDIIYYIDYFKYGQTCIFAGKFSNQTIEKSFYVKVALLFPGIVYSFEPLMINFQPISKTEKLKVISLRYGGHGHYNIHINTTFPMIGETVLSDIKEITIQFYDEVVLSTGRIEIYQGDGNLRQYIRGINAAMITQSEDGRIRVKILQSTFNKPGSYYVIIHDDFVRIRDYQESLFGVKELVSRTERSEESLEYMIGRVRLTLNGTEFFASLNEKKRNEFQMNLIKDFADAIPINFDRITINKIDTSEDQTILSIKIQHDENKQEILTSLATICLDTLIKNKNITAIRTGMASKYLDEDYGFQPPNWWETNKSPLIAVFAILSIFILLFLWAKHKNSEQKKLMDYLFQVFPFIVSVGLAFTIIKQENKNDEFLEWSRNNMQMISIFTLLAGANIEVLTLLESKIAGYTFFNAKFSETALNKIIWGTWFNLFEEIPQVIIQIVTYDIIPLLALSSSCLNLLINIIRITKRTYNTYIPKEHKYEEMFIGNSNSDYSDVIDKDDGNFGGLIDECIF
ncbi:5900_t:CDS:2 [Funneliformis mosseae]|uniref:5900_t:CDS:1 n=1 Tax=Funneliformis mosseae TaxID=27381 RepID=A0A9N9A281_FUNMO|nr:5900_t:CDS:2 [Funneliformis mosseae]